MKNSDEIKQRLTDKIREYEWDDVNSIIDIIVPAIKIVVDKNSKDSISQIGGQPNLPESIGWPSAQNGSPMAFYFQINFKETTLYDVNKELPEKGIFYCFVSLEDGYFDPEEGEYKFYFIKEESVPELRDFPVDLENENKFKATPISFEYYFQLLWDQNVIVREKYAQGQISEQDFDYLNEVLHELFSEYYKEDSLFTINHLLGDPYPIQDKPNDIWALKYYNLDYDDLYMEENEEKMDEFVSLISFNLNDKNGFEEAGDVQVYVGIHKDDLKNQKLENAVFTTQNS